MVQELNYFNPGKNLIGLTGVFGSGKTTVAHLFEELGAFIVDADLYAREALMPGSAVYEQVAELFPDCLPRRGAHFQRDKLAGIVFREDGRRKQLEKIVHPYVFQRMVAEVMDAEEEVAVLEIPLLFETGFERYCNLTVMVTASEGEMLRRLAEKGFDENQVRSRWKAQMPLHEKILRADLVVDNSNGMEETKRQVYEIWKTQTPSRKE